MCNELNFQLLGNNTFVIYDVNKDDEGLYYCNVSNKYGINRSTNKLQVYKPTYFVKIPTPKRLTLEAGQTTELFCQAISDPRLSIDYRWTINGERINNSETFQILKDRLRIVAARGRHSGIIDCAAVTDVDVKLASMQLIVKDVPANPEVDTPMCSERKAIIRFKKSNDHADTIRKYIIEVMTDFRKGFWERVVEETNISKHLYEVDVTLTPWVNYTFRVVAENSHGRSDAKVGSDVEDVAQTVKCSTRPSFPYTNPSGVWAEGNEPDNLIIYWNPMDKYYWNAPNLQYLIRYKLNEPHAPWTEFLVEDALANHTIIREQPTFREYLVQVRAVNAIGLSIVEPESVKGYSGEDIPTLTPNNLRVDQVRNFTSVSFSWEEVDPKSANGKFEGYEIEYWKDSGRKYKITVPPGVHNKTITVFSANSNYTAVIRTKNKHHVSHESNSVRFEMPEGIPSKVHGLRVISVGASSLLIQWEKPRVPNGVIRGYFLSFENDKNETEETYVVHKRTYYLHEKCSSDTLYKVGVWAETSAGEGPKLLRTVRTWPAGSPDTPVFEVFNVTKNSMIVRWIPSNSSVWKMPGSSFSVNYSVEGSNDYIESQRVYLPDTLIALENLQESTRYSLVGVAKDGNEMTKTDDPLPITTLSKINMSEMQKENLRSIVWFIAILIVVCIAMMTIFLTCCCEERKGRRYGVHRKEREIRNPVESEEERKFLEYQYGYKS
ncbi:unnamed protein product [Auanema sp. JU1783]|nr:unnamed protein product [Auanema sp. JU1783]